jgi:Ni/Fe-hydrogenase subunit HybB-like protein
MSHYIDGVDMDLSEHADSTLNGSKKPFKGIATDIKRKLPFYISDFTDCLNLQCVATTLYMYLVSLCSLVAFGGMLGSKTDGYMVIKSLKKILIKQIKLKYNCFNKATMECILAGAVCGLFFSLFSGQPLNIISATGPMLILESIIYGLCQ